MLKTRVITALLLVTGLLGALFLLPPIAWLVLAASICGAAAWEWGALGGLGGWTRRVFAVFMGILCLAVGAMTGLGSPGTAQAPVLLALYLVSGVFWLAAVPVWLSMKWRLRGLGTAALIGLVVLLPPALALAHLRQVGPWVLLAAMAVVWVADIAAYFAGRAFGRHKLAPNISPGKTWEGVGGAMAGVVVFGLIVIAAAVPSLLGGASLLLAVAMLAGLTAVSIQGDLFESLLKRQAGVKDSGNLLPGHGGILDRIDSLTSTLPLAGLAALWLAH